jgi:predicted ester cyclase
MHQRLFLGNPPTFRQVKIQGIIFARTSYGWIVEDWILADQMGIPQQLGIVPPPPVH